MPRPSREQRQARNKDLFGEIFDSELPPHIAVAKFERAAKEAMVETLWYWFHSILPTNFQAYAATRRGYPPASQRYRNYKSRLTQIDGMSRPALVFSGPAVKARVSKKHADFNLPHIPNYRDKILANPEKPPTARATAHGFVGRIVVYEPQYVRRNRKWPNMGQYATYLTADDRRQLDRYFAIALGQNLGMEVNAGSMESDPPTLVA